MKHPRVPRSSENHFFIFSKLRLQSRQLDTETTLHESKRAMVRVSEEPFMALPYIRPLQTNGTLVLVTSKGQRPTLSQLTESLGNPLPHRGGACQAVYRPDYRRGHGRTTEPWPSSGNRELLSLLQRSVHGAQTRVRNRV